MVKGNSLWTGLGTGSCKGEALIKHSLLHTEVKEHLLEVSRGESARIEGTSLLFIIISIIPEAVLTKREPLTSIISIIIGSFQIAYLSDCT